MDSNTADLGQRPELSPARYMFAYAGLELIEGERRGLVFVREVMVRFPLPVVLDFLARVNTVLAGPGTRHDLHKQTQLVACTCSETLIGQIKSKSKTLDGPPHMLLFHEAQLLFAGRLAVQHCADRSSVRTEAGLDDLVRALLALNDNFDEHPRPGEPENDWFIRALFPSMVFAHEDRMERIAARWEELLHAIPSTLTSLPDWVDFDALFRQATGCDLNDYRAMVAAFLATYHKIEASSRENPAARLDLNHLFLMCRLSEDDSRCVETISRDVDRLRSDFAEAGVAGGHPYYFRPFYSHPIVRAGDSAWIVSNRLLTNALGPGVYHVIFTYLLQLWRAQAAGLAPVASDPEHAKTYVDNQVRRYRGYVGAIFHAYVGALLARALPEGGQCQLTDLDAVRGASGRRRCDFVICDGARVVLVECKSRFLTLDAAVAGEAEVVKGNYRKLVLESSDQMDSTAVDIEESVFDLDGIRPERVRAYLPVVVTLDYVPTEYAIYSWLCKEIENHRAATRKEESAEYCILRRKMAPLQIMDVGVLEHIEPILAKQTLSSLLVEKNRDVPLRVTSFWNYVAHKNLRPPINAHLQQTLEQLLTRWGEFWHTRFVETR